MLNLLVEVAVAAVKAAAVAVKAVVAAVYSNHRVAVEAVNH